MILIEGMGVTGSFIARCLSQLEIPFGWMDKDSAYTAWGASTGCIYPSGDEAEQSAYQTWESWIGVAGNPLTEAGRYHFLSASPPNGAKAVYLRRSNDLKSLSLPSLHLNVAEFVLTTRALFAGQRVSGWSDKPSKRILTWTNRDYYLWGWSCIAPVEFSEDFEQDLRPSFYHRAQRYQLNYIYPCPATPFYYLGTSTIMQKSPSNRDGTKDVERFAGSLPKSIKVDWKRSQGIREGWRPISKRASQVNDKSFILQGQAGNGVRLAPVYLRQILDWMGYNGELPNPLLS